jgi:hypothetical protein
MLGYSDHEHPKMDLKMYLYIFVPSGYEMKLKLLHPPPGKEEENHGLSVP